MSTTLYRLYDSEGELLYVGITAEWTHRMREHKKSKFWWRDVASVNLQNYDRREQAEAAEYAAIRKEGPRHNLTHALEVTPAPPRPPLAPLRPQAVVFESTERLAHTTAEVATMLGCSRQFVYLEMGRGLLASVKLGGSRRILRADLLSYLAGDPEEVLS